TPFPLDDDWLGLVSDLLQNIRPSIRQQLSQPLPNIDELMDPVTFRESTVSKAHWRKELEEVAIQITAIEQEISELRESRAEDLALKLTGAHTNLESARGRYAEAKRKSDRQKEGIAEREKALRDEIESERESKNFALSKTTLEHRTLLNAANRKEPELGAHLSDSLAKRLTSLNESDLYQVKDNASALHKVRVDSQEAGWLWPQRAISEVINRSDVLWAEVWTNSTNEIESLPSEEELKELEAPLYRWPEGLSEEALYFDAVELLRYYEGGGRNGWPLLRPEIYKRTKHVRQTTVDGAECNNLRTLRKLVSFLSACRAIESLHALWSKASKRIRDLKPTKDIKQSANALRSCHSLLNTIYSKGVELQQLLLNTPRAGDNIGQLARSAGLAQAETEKFESLHREWESKRKDIQAKLADLEVEKLEVAEELDRRLQDGIKKIIHDFVPADESPVKEAKYKVKDLSEALKEAQERVSDEGERRLDPLRRKKNNLLESLSQLAGGRESTRKEAVQVQKQYQAHRVCAEVIESIDNEDAGKYSDAHSTIADIESNRPAFEKLLNAINALKSEGKKTYQWLLDSNWNQEDQAKASDLEQAWNWSRAKSWFDNFNSRKVENIEGELKAANQLISDSIAKMCGLLAWRKCKERASNSQQQSLVAWELAVKRIRGGKGKHAAKHRRAAHQHMREAQGMIPALVSPLARLVESVEIKPELFDIVIVDEASQLGPEGMILFYLAKQLIVVGDHEQISPEDIGMDKDQVFALAVCRGF
ncbi:MAG: AAA domain-containing protein, partial [Planctomycetota bacterium]